MNQGLLTIASTVSIRYSIIRSFSSSIAPSAYHFVFLNPCFCLSCKQIVKEPSGRFKSQIGCNLAPEWVCCSFFTLGYKRPFWDFICYSKTMAKAIISRNFLIILINTTLLIIDIVFHLSLWYNSICELFPTFLKRYTGSRIKSVLGAWCTGRKLNGTVQSVCLEEAFEPHSSFGNPGVIKLLLQVFRGYVNSFCFMHLAT